MKLEHYSEEKLKEDILKILSKCSEESFFYHSPFQITIKEGGSLN
jgi:hypothetical protein